jgi:hypothetical protein
MPNIHRVLLRPYPATEMQGVARHGSRTGLRESWLPNVIHVMPSASEESSTVSYSLDRLLETMSSRISSAKSTKNLVFKVL